MWSDLDEDFEVTGGGPISLIPAHDLTGLHPDRLDCSASVSAGTCCTRRDTVEWLHGPCGGCGGRYSTRRDECWENSFSCRTISVCDGERQELIISQEKYANSILHHMKLSFSTSLLLLKSRLLERCISKSLAT